MKLEERPTYAHDVALAEGCSGPSGHPENKAGYGISTLGGRSLCGVMVCSHGIAVYLRAGFSLCLFMGNYEESYGVTHYSHDLQLSLSLLFTSSLPSLETASWTEWVQGLIPSKNAH